jgi:TolB-like protein
MEKPAQAAHLSIVVLPFANLSGDPSQDYFADGITDNLTTDLSRIRNSFVIASTTAFTYKGKTVDAKEIGKELGVRYVLEGSAQRDQNRVRVNAQLIDAETGAHLWAERFEEDVADLFKLQDQIVARLDNTLGYQLVKAEAERSTRSKNPDVVDLTMRGNALFQLQPLTKDNNDAARTACPEIDYDAKILGQANVRSRSPPIAICLTMRRAITSSFCAARMRRSAPPMRVSRSIQIRRCCTGCALSRKIRLAISSKPSPT